MCCGRNGRRRQGADLQGGTARRCGPVVSGCGTLCDESAGPRHMVATPIGRIGRLYKRNRSNAMRAAFDERMRSVSDRTEGTPRVVRASGDGEGRCIGDAVELNRSAAPRA